MSRASTAGAPLLVTLVPLVLALAACSGAAGATPTPSATSVTDGAVSDGSAGSAAPGGAMPGRGGGVRGGGVQGEIAAVTGTTMQVQDTDSQTAVTWSDATTFRRTVAADASAAAVGACVLVVGGTDAAATSVAVSDAVDGGCDDVGRGLGPSGGGMPTDLPGGMPTDLPGGMPTDLPGGMPSGMPTGAPDGAAAGAGFDVTSGLVTAVADGSVTVTSGSASTTVTVDGSTTWTRTSAADASAVAVGLCAAAQGENDDAGGMTAASVTLSDPTDGACAVRTSGRTDG